MKGWVLAEEKSARYRTIPATKPIRTGRAKRTGWNRDSMVNWYNQTDRIRSIMRRGKAGSAHPSEKILVTINRASSRLAARKKIQVKVTKANTSSCFTRRGTLFR